MAIEYEVSEVSRGRRVDVLFDWNGSIPNKKFYFPNENEVFAPNIPPAGVVVFDVAPNNPAVTAAVLDDESLYNRKKNARTDADISSK